jgi:hypothetical protein
MNKLIIIIILSLITFTICKEVTIEVWRTKANTDTCYQYPFKYNSYEMTKEVYHFNEIVEVNNFYKNTFNDEVNHCTLLNIRSRHNLLGFISNIYSDIEYCKDHNRLSLIFGKHNMDRDNLNDFIDTNNIEGYNDDHPLIKNKANQYLVLIYYRKLHDNNCNYISTQMYRKKLLHLETTNYIVPRFTYFNSMEEAINSIKIWLRLESDTNTCYIAMIKTIFPNNFDIYLHYQLVS